MLAAKGNQPSLHDTAYGASGQGREADPAPGVTHDDRKQIENTHGQYDTIVSDTHGLPPAWPDVAEVIPISRERKVKVGHADTTRHSITSRRGTETRTRNRSPGGGRLPTTVRAKNHF